MASPNPSGSPNSLKQWAQPKPKQKMIGDLIRLLHHHQPPSPPAASKLTATPSLQKACRSSQLRYTKGRPCTHSPRPKAAMPLTRR
ncbi:hypothetical protein ACLB2K_031886 [Fragaria x ananassa]